MAHRGPDDAGLWASADAGVILGSRRLAILDLSPDGHQPMVDEATQCVIVFNGEIYNFLEIRADLEACGHQCRSRSDTEVLLAAYTQWGPDCLRRLNGMFAFAIWDQRRQELFAARDRFGEKPFYYVYDRAQNRLVFASEMKALFATGAVSPEPSCPDVYRYLALHEVDAGETTLFLGVRALRAAHALRYVPRTGFVQSWRYWDLDPAVELRLPSDDAYGERLGELLRDSVRLRLRSDVPVGSSLSGGLDSSTVVGLMADELGRGVQQTFSARFLDPSYDEGRFIEAVADHTGARSHCVYPDPEKLPNEMERITWHQEQPFYSTSVYAQWTVMRLAREHGVTVLLDGQGADETLGGYHFFFSPYWRSLVREGQWLRAGRALDSYRRAQGWARLLVALGMGVGPVWRSRLRGLVGQRAVAPEFARAWGQAPAARAPRFRNDLQEALYASVMRTTLPALLRYADRNSMAFSREVRLPFLDHRLVEYLFAISGELKIRGAETKVVLRRAIRGIVPEVVRLRRDKLGFAPPEKAWLRGPLNAWAQDLVRSRRFRSRGWIDARAAEGELDALGSGRLSRSSLLWRWLSLEVWAQVFLDAAGPVQAQACEVALPACRVSVA
jgi:asparagine synthase (glutamine-hydrolysing)